VAAQPQNVDVFDGPHGSLVERHGQTPLQVEKLREGLTANFEIPVISSSPHVEAHRASELQEQVLNLCVFTG